MAEFVIDAAIAMLFAAGGWFRVSKRQSPERIGEAALITTAAFGLASLTILLAAV